MKYGVKTWTAALLATVALPGLAAAADAVTTVDLNMRAGPSTRFPVVDVVPDDAAVAVHGCVRGYHWCDVTWRGARGWVYADYLRYPFRDRYVPRVEYAPTVGLPIIGFSFEVYWDDHYRDRPWYHRRARWREVWREHRRGIRADIRKERREGRAERRQERREGRADRRRDRRKERVERRQQGSEKRVEGPRDRRKRIEGRQERRENRAERRRDRRERVDRRQDRRDARAERRRDQRLERRRESKVPRGDDRSRQVRPDRAERRAERQGMRRDGGAGRPGASSSPRDGRGDGRQSHGRGRDG